MSEENQALPVDEAQNMPTETEPPEVVDQEQQADEPQESAPQDGEDEADKALKRMQRRIDKRTADTYRARAEAEMLRKRVQELESQSGTTNEPASVGNDPIAIAKEIARVERFTEQSNALVSEGGKKHPDFMAALKDLSAEVGGFVQNGLPTPFMEVVMDVSDSPSELLYYLGKNPDIASDLEGLSQAKLAKQLTRIESELAAKAKPKVSNAPKPLEPVKAKAADSALPSDSDTAEAWIAKERKRMESKGLTRYG